MYKQFKFNYVIKNNAMQCLKSARNLKKSYYYNTKQGYQLQLSPLRKTAERVLLIHYPRVIWECKLKVQL
jgi:hypothetical protein